MLDDVDIDKPAMDRLEVGAVISIRILPAFPPFGDGVSLSLNPIYSTAYPHLRQGIAGAAPTRRRGQLPP
jgi:hypothetical protein